jgi:hypothetical protein
MTQDRLKELLSYDDETGEFRWKQSRRGLDGRLAGSIDSRGYSQIKVDGRLYLTHRLAWLYAHGHYPDRKIEVNHIDENKLNNAIKNLRLAERSQNLANVRKAQATNALGVRGVRKLRNGRFNAQIQVNGHKKNLGYFSTVEDAKAAYETAHAKAFGTFSPYFSEAA